MRYRAALITGASSGIGEALARRLDAETDLLLTGRNADQLRRLQTDLARPGRRVDFVVADLAMPAEVDRLIEAAEAFRIDLLINNAGIGRMGSILAHPAPQEDEMVAVNIAAPLKLTRALLPGMVERAKRQDRRSGVMLLGSVVAFAPFPYLATYAATKAFNVTLARCLAVELAGDPVDILALCPGSTRTRFSERAGADFDRSPFSHDADRVARDGIAMLGRRTVHVVGLRNRAFTALLRLLPSRLIAPLIGRGVKARMGTPSIDGNGRV